MYRGVDELISTCLADVGSSPISSETHRGRLRTQRMTKPRATLSPFASSVSGGPGWWYAITHGQFTYRLILERSLARFTHVDFA